MISVFESRTVASAMIGLPMMTVSAGRAIGITKARSIVTRMGSLASACEIAPEVNRTSTAGRARAERVAAMDALRTGCCPRHCPRMVNEGLSAHLALAAVGVLFVGLYLR